MPDRIGGVREAPRSERAPAGRLLAVTLLAGWLACTAHRQHRPDAAPSGAPSTWLFYTAGDELVAVWPGEPGSQVVVEPTPGKVVDPELVLVGRHQESTGLLTDVHAHAVVYFHDDPAGMRTVRTAPAAGRRPPVPRQLSRLAVPSQDVCGTTVLPDPARPDDTLIFVETAPGGACSGSSHAGFLIRLSMDAAAEPLRFAPFAGAVALESARGGIGRIAWWSEEVEEGRGTHAGLVRFSDPGAPATTPETAGLVFDDVLGVGDRLWFTLAGELRFLVGPEGMRHPGGVPAPITRSDHVADGRHLYFVDGSSIRRVRLDGTRAAELVCSVPPGQDPTDLRMSAGRVLFQTRQANGSWLWSVPKAGGVPQPLLSARELRVTASEHWVFTLGGGEVRAMREDGSDPATLASGIESLLVVADGPEAPPGLSAFAAARGIVLVERLVQDGQPVLGLRAVNPVDRTLLDVGSLPRGYDRPRLLRNASGTATLLAASDQGRKDDVFLLDTAVPGSVRQLTRTPAADEKLVGPVDCGTGASSAWALGGLALAALLRTPSRRSRPPPRSGPWT